MPDTASTHARPRWVSVLVFNIPYAVLYGIAIWLVALTNSDQAKASADWLIFIPLVGLVATVSGWRWVGTGGRAKALYLLRQVLHWGALMLVINLLFMPSMLQFLNAEDHGFVIIFLLGLAAILSGIHIDWKMAVFGLFLIGSGIGMGYIEDNLMMVIMTATAIAGVGSVLALFVLSRLRSRSASG